MSPRIVIVTGAGGGIGGAAARVLAGPERIVLVADLALDAAEAVAAALRTEGHRAEAIAIDVADEASVAALAQRARALGTPWALVAAAGFAAGGPLAETSIALWDRLMVVNLRGTFLCLQALLPDLVTAGGGKVVLLASTSSFVASSTPLAAYDVTKAAIRQLAVSSAAEYAPLGVNINTVAPGLIRTRLTEGVLDDDAKRARATISVPAGRVGTPEDIAGAIAYLCSEAADYVHGHTLVVDGGWLLR